LCPIAVAITLRRLVAKWLLVTSQGRSATATLARLQRAIAKGRPCEVVAMGVLALTDTLHGSTGWLLLQVDLKNAFKSLNRPAIMDAVEVWCPSMLPWVRQACQAAPLLLGREVIWSTLGMQQTNPWAPFCSPQGSRPPRTPEGPCLRAGPVTGGTWTKGCFWGRLRSWKGREGPPADPEATPDDEEAISPDPAEALGGDKANSAQGIN